MNEASIVSFYNPFGVLKNYKSQYINILIKDGGSLKLNNENKNLSIKACVFGNNSAKMVLFFIKLNDNKRNFI